MRNALKPEFRNRIHIIVKGTGLHTTDLLDYTLRECRLSGGYDHVWLAYDRDDFDLQDFDSMVSECVRNSDEITTYHPLWSNPCVEVWMLLHFGYTTAELTSAEAIAKTDALFQKELNRPYKKNDARLFADLSSRLADAVANANQLVKWHESQDALRPSQMNPGTQLQRIAEALREYIEI